MSLAKKLLRIFLDTSIVLAVILFAPGLPPHCNFESFTVTPPRPLTGVLHPKDYALNNAEKLFQGQLYGPEGLEESPNEPDVFYTTTMDGSVVKIYDNGSKIKVVANFGEQCKVGEHSPKCGRPLGIRFDKDGNLIVSDSYLGIYKVDPISGGFLFLINSHDINMI